ncbi:ribosome biogenesis GTP-binding protein YihA/YsxC [Alkalisalibacterium limincola]|uniref:Probable GTP-binding protein EngB n=1 Tax=Alkalisalibacterium limincola TaxID=2699169 RepID=A0A5C8KYF6_9GAMM|nr:ribosome biogenesis GTP-binding protein YihA/YsxC [Alkalisalibacterium limincola]TXK64893.1 YihA family ribosome biogenesis GTP-binding protein [Alkalisalibacterium limincola]
MKNLLNGARYLLAAHLSHQLPGDGGREVAFAGRSNAGKSTALNSLVGHTKLARTSKTPGRTQQLVYFDFEHAPGKYLVDLPGYGYAKVPGELKSHWLGFVNDFFRHRQALVGLVVVMDVRHPLREFDQQMLAYAVERGLPAHCLLTKSDKLSRGAAKQTLLKIQRELPEGVTVQLFSGLNKEGVEQAREVVLDWLEMNREAEA